MSSTTPTAGYGRSADVLGLLVLALIVYLTLDGVRSYYRLRKFQGPWLAVTSKIWILKCLYYKNTHWELKRVCEKYGRRFCGGSAANSSLTDLC